MECRGGVRSGMSGLVACVRMAIQSHNDLAKRLWPEPLEHREVLFEANVSCNADTSLALRMNAMRDDRVWNIGNAAIKQTDAIPGIPIEVRSPIAAKAKIAQQLAIEHYARAADGVAKSEQLSSDGTRIREGFDSERTGQKVSLNPQVEFSCTRAALCMLSVATERDQDIF